MALVMTKASDVVEVAVEIDGEVAFKVKVGVIPNEIGEEISALLNDNIGLLKAQAAEDEDATIAAIQSSTKSVNEIVKLYMKYGIRDLTGLEYADGSDVICVTEEEKDTGFTILSEDTLRLLLGNKELVTMASKEVAEINRIGVGKFLKGGFKTVEDAKGPKLPLGKSLAESSAS